MYTNTHNHIHSDLHPHTFILTPIKILTLTLANTHTQMLHLQIATLSHPPMIIHVYSDTHTQSHTHLSTPLTHTHIHTYVYSDIHTHSDAHTYILTKYSCTHMYSHTYSQFTHMLTLHTQTHRPTTFTYRISQHSHTITLIHIHNPHNSYTVSHSHQVNLLPNTYLSHCQLWHHTHLIEGCRALGLNLVDVCLFKSLRIEISAAVVLKSGPTVAFNKSQGTEI